MCEVFGTPTPGPGLNRRDLEGIIEPLAAKVHEAWIRQRAAEGWTWGRVHNRELKQHPSLVPYAQLPDREKEIDRQTAWASILALLDFGFEILPPKPKSNDESLRFSQFLQRLRSASTVPLSELRSMWSQLCSEPFRYPAEIHLSLGDRILKQGEAILAYDVLSQGLDALEPGLGGRETDEPLRRRLIQLLALALAQSGASGLAENLLRKLCEQGCSSPETLGLLGRVYKDLARKADSPTARGQWLEQSLKSYLAGFEKAESALRPESTSATVGDACYCGINAAAVQVLRDKIPEARLLATRVKQICLDWTGQTDVIGRATDYWLAATLAETELISGHVVEAEVAYRNAARLVHGNWRELSSTRRQVRLLSPHLGRDSSFVERLFPPISVVVFAPPALVRLAEEARMRDWEMRQRNEVRQHLTKAGVVCGYVSVLSPADLLFIEMMLESDREINVILPSSRALCRQIFEAVPEWAARFDNVLARVQSVTEDTQPSCLDETINLSFARLRALGAGILRAQQLDAELHVWAVDNCWSEARPTCSPILHRLDRRQYPYETMKETAWQDLSLSLQASRGGDSEQKYAIRAMLFGDVKGYSKLTDTELLRFAHHFMSRVSAVLEESSCGILSRRTAGDGLFLVFGDLEVAAVTALQLRDMVANTQWEKYGLPQNMGIRISLDAGPVYGFRDPVTHHEDVCGAYVNRAARIEPITPPNEVYASEAFAAVQVATSPHALRFDYVGQTQLPKGFGMTRLYCVSR